MKVLKSAVGADFSWRQGQEIIVDRELAANLEKSGIAECMDKERESAVIAIDEAAVMPSPRRRQRN